MRGHGCQTHWTTVPVWGSLPTVVSVLRCPYPVSLALAVGHVPLASLFRPVLGVGLEQPLPLGLC